MSKIKILIIEDNIDDAGLIVRQLQKSGMSFTSEVVDARKIFEQSLDLFNPDIVLSDYSLPSFDAVTAFEIAQNRNLKIPFIIVSGTVGEHNAVMLMKNGVTDFSSKENLEALPQKVIRALKEAEERHEKEELLEKLKVQTAELLFANQELEIQNTEKEKRTIELLNANKELLAFNFISSHDLQEPLRKIQTFISVIKEKEMENLSPSGKSNIERIHVAATRMRQLIEDLLNFSRVSIVKDPYEINDLRTIIEDIKEELKDDISEKRAVIEVKGLVPVNVILFQFRQLFHNLLSNSLKFSALNETQQIIIESTIIKNNDFKLLSLNNSSLKCDYWHLHFKDNGIGFDADFNEIIFMIFQRLHHPEEYSGTGIGLAIVKKIVENHNGIITASGKLNEGAVFNIYIPAENRSKL
ncbi:MAG: hybrid sensor histidine kinase/response regulator [Flavobacterium sp.]|nr:MAG: hybrid sensor histidine kinase/response regulator [Flavobacterium sp.]